MPGGTKLKNSLIARLLFALAVFFSSAEVYANPPEITAESAYVIDADTGIVLYSKNAHEQRYPASITKLMTVLLALEYANGDFTKPVRFEWSSVGGTEGTSSIGMKPGEVIPLEEALYAILLHSANEVSNAVAELVAGTQTEFAEMMTARAKELGCLGTQFKNASGLPDPEHYTTAYDMALIMREVIKHPDFIRFASTRSYQVSPTEMTDEPRGFVNTNRLIRPATDYYNPLIVCGKTGYTDAARHTLVTLAEKDGARIITAVLRTPQFGIYTDTTALVDYCFTLYDDFTIFDKDTYDKQIPVDTGGGIIKPLYIYADGSIIKHLPRSFPVGDCVITEVLPDTLTAPVDKGERVGYLTAEYNGSFLGSVVLSASEGVAVSAAETTGAPDTPGDITAAEQPEGSRFFAFVTGLPFTLAVYCLAIVAAVILTVRNITASRRGYSRFSIYKG